MKSTVLRAAAWAAATLLLPSAPISAQPGAPAAAAAATADGQLAALLSRYAPSIVRVEAVLETRLNFGGQGEAQDSRLDLLGAIVDPSGLVMIWNSHISPARMVEMMQNAGRQEGMGIQVVPKSFTVSLPEGEVPAILAATDSALDLAFLQLERPPAQPLPFVDFRRADKPAVGDQVVVVSRLGRGFDHAPFLQTAHVGGALKKPREAWILDGNLTAFGLPVFDRDGVPVGALTTVVTRGGETESAAGGPTVGQMLGGAFGAPGEGPLGVFVLPGERVASLVKLAAERAKQLLQERAATAKP
ncbi:MAG TPA: trypsin-like peptidase domain-containing protein [Thermoanaerobaculia bacterium]|nr:trypsin-like peptidase domain-containing protein [Thermoanaerobaculia bacterium]